MPTHTTTSGAPGAVVEPTPARTGGRLLVAFTGQAGSGKTTHAQLLRARFKGDVLSFATPLKKVTSDLFEERMDDPQFARSAHQEFGVLARKLAGPTFWVEKLVAKISTNRNCFVDDCRYMSEYYALTHLGFLIIRLGASPATLRSRRPSMTEEQWNHESEVDAAFIREDKLFFTDEMTEQETHAAIVAWLENR